MSVTDQMLRDLDKRGALAAAAAATGASPPAAAATAPNALASAYAAVRLLQPRSRLSRHVLLAGGVAALLPIAWATNTHFERSVAAPMVTLAVTSGALATATATAAPAAPTPGVTAITAPASAASVDAAPALPASGPEVSAPAAGVVAVAAGALVAATPAPVATPIPVAAAGPVTTDVAMTRSQPAPPALTAEPKPLKPTPPARTAAAPPGTDAEGAARADSLKDTRLALASPAVPKEETCIERRPTDARDDLTRAGEAMSIGRTSDAIALLRKVIQAEPDNEPARLALLSLLAERGRDDTWRSTLAESARALPKRFGLAAAQGLAESGRFDESLVILQSLPESIRDLRYFSALGATHQQLNQRADAVAAFDAALGIAPGGSPHCRQCWWRRPCRCNRWASRPKRGATWSACARCPRPRPMCVNSRPGSWRTRAERIINAALLTERAAAQSSA